MNGLSMRILMSFTARYFPVVWPPVLMHRIIPLLLQNFKFSYAKLHQSHLGPFLQNPMNLDLGFLKASLSSKVWGKESIVYFDLFCVLWDQIPIPIQWCAHTFPNLSFAEDAHVETLSAFLSITEFNFSWILAFLILYLGGWTLSLYSSSFHLLYIFFSCMSFVRSFVLIHADLLAWFVCWSGLTVLELGRRNWGNQLSLSDRIPDLQWYYHISLQD